MAPVTDPVRIESMTIDVPQPGPANHRRPGSELPLGNDLFVSPQAVSKWENGESLPDVGTLPGLCKTLGTSADALLGIDSELGIETLGARLAQRISGLRDKGERHAALMTALGLLIPTSDMTNQERNISYQLSHPDKGLEGLSFWSRSGLVCFAGGETMEEDMPSSDMVDILRTLVEPECWPVAFFLLEGPNSFAALMEADLAESARELTDVLDKLMAAGLLVQDKDGYRLEEHYGLLLAGMIKALCQASLREDIGRGILVRSG